MIRRAQPGSVKRGFSLIELLIVVTIILIVATIAIPNLLRSRIAANQASAVGSTRTLNTSNITCASTYNTGYPAQIFYLGPGSGGNPTATQAGLIDSVLSGSGGNTSSKSGYNFGYTPGMTDAAVSTPIRSSPGRLRAVQPGPTTTLRPNQA